VGVGVAAAGAGGGDGGAAPPPPPPPPAGGPPDAEEGDRGLDEATDECVHEAVVSVSEARRLPTDRPLDAEPSENLAKGCRFASCPRRNRARAA